MKRKLALFFALTFLIAVLGIKYSPQIIEDKPNAYEVGKFLEELDETPDPIGNFYLLFDTYKLDTKNFEQTLSFFDNYNYYKISEVYPYINPLHQMSLYNITVMSYDGRTLKEGISNIYNKYMLELEKYRLSDEIDKVLVNGFRIRMIKIRVDKEVLRLFLEKYSTIKYSISPYGLFKSL